MSKKTILIALFAFISVTGLAQKHLPGFQYSREPALLSGCVINAGTQKADDVTVSYTLKYSSAMGDALRRHVEALDDSGCFSMNLPTGTTVKCRVFIGDGSFTCYVVPGDTVSFTLDLQKLKTQGMAEALTFNGQLADFNHDLVYATEQGFDPQTIYLDMEGKRNKGELIDDLPEKSEDGYFQYLDSIYQHVNEQIDNHQEIGEAYREFAKAVNHYNYGEMIQFCAQSIQYAGIDTEEAYDAYVNRERQRLESYMQNDPWTSPVLSYVMWCTPGTYITSRTHRPVKLPEDYQQCYLASKYLMQIGQQSQLLSDAQIDSVRTFLPELGQDVLDYNNKLEQKLSFINEQGKSRICLLPDDKKHSEDVLAALLESYRGRPVLLDLWETTCGVCRLAFKEMHDKKNELAGRIHFVNIASERSDLSTWERLVPSYIGNHYRLTEQQLQALHRQLSCDTNALPVWVVINADGSIHHTIVGWVGVDRMMKELESVLSIGT